MARGGGSVAYTNVFRRYELKYLISLREKEKILSTIEPYMRLDSYGRTTIRNLYLDTPDYRLIRRSIEKPAYKEKIRIRSYSRVESSDNVFVELKKKYEKVVYKRRVALPEMAAMCWMLGEMPCPINSQITREIDYFASHYAPLSPVVFLSYDREAYYLLSGGDFRVTFDDNILYRESDLSLCSDAYGKSILPDDTVMMEIKCSGAIPLWLVKTLSRERIYRTSFSKYGTAYRDILTSNTQKEKHIYV